ncbi:MAG: LacI family DNA-binding transcriptional regulator [Tepidisphaeraceae bacterium]
MAKYESICELIEKRIRLGDYTMKELPAEHRLASEVGVSRMTARRAVLKLVKRGLLVRKPNGRLVVSRQSVSGELEPQLAMLMPAFVSPEFERWRASLDAVCKKIQVRLRKVDFVHWNDPVLTQTFESFDGVFLLPGSEAPPADVMRRMADAGPPLVVLDNDWSQLGIRSINLTPPHHVRALLDHLAGLGHVHIACVNTQPVHDEIRSRIEHVQQWQEERGVKGRLINEPVLPYEDPLAKAHEVVSKFLQVRQPDFTAIVATTTHSAMGVMRALHERSLAIGRDVSICALVDEGLCRYLVPSLTCTQMPDPGPFLEVALEWMLRSGFEWNDSLLLQPANVSLFVGESTGPCPSAA